MNNGTKLVTRKLNGSKARAEIGEKDEFPSVESYLWSLQIGTMYSTYGPNPSIQKNYLIAQKMCFYISWAFCLSIKAKYLIINCEN